jgi:GNAT superfamily N-acetyltransferase
VNLEAQAEYLEYLRRQGETHEIDGGFAVKTGAFSNTENGVVARGPVAEVAELVAWLADVPASWLDVGGSNGRALVAAGARPENDGREMVARIADLQLVPPDDVVIESAGVGEWFDFASAHDWFGRPDERVAFERLYRGLVGERFRLTVARVDGEVVGFASAFYGSTFVLLTQVVVDDAFRRRGVGTALAADRIERARALGLRYASLGPSPDGAELYAALGFELRRTPPNCWYYLPSASARRA